MLMAHDMTLAEGGEVLADSDIGAAIATETTTTRATPIRQEAPPIHPIAPTVAIIMPTLNEAATVGDQMRAILAHGALQAPGVWRVIVVDNDSDDDTAPVARTAGAQAAQTGMALLMDAVCHLLSA